MTRLGYILVGLFTIEALVVVAVIDPAPRLLWNASASAPLGLYHLHKTDHPHVGQLVAILPPAPLARWMAGRHYLPEGVPLLKHIAALPGQRFCRHGVTITIDGKTVATAKPRDIRGRALPVWSGCRTVPANTLLLMNPSIPDSLDGRYFGALPARNVLGQAIPIITRETSASPWRWRGFAPPPSSPSACKRTLR